MSMSVCVCVCVCLQDISGTTCEIFTNFLSLLLMAVNLPM